ncbi:metallophosphoesterase [Anaerorhabdus sp.]|uniref:metallophosphoesterase n=1 Tax=Anaerorhabdus sp. TaxID=1872524 RepID=UPI002FC7D7D1
MKIIVVSDNHGRIEPLKEVQLVHQDAAAFIHCGDSELPIDYLAGFAAVRGNNDFYGDLPESKIIELGSHRILIAHGHRLMFLDNRELLINKAKSCNCDIVCFGHTHVFETRVVDGIYLVNPGSISRNRDGSIPSYAIINIEDDKIDIERKDYKLGCKL